MLHGTGIAFCHKVDVKIAKSQPTCVQPGVSCDSSLAPPDMCQPVLLEVQAIDVNGFTAKTLFDNGSTAALVTHSFAEKAGLNGRKVSY